MNMTTKINEMRRPISASKAFWRKVDKAAESRGLSASAFVRLVVSDALATRGKNGEES